MNSLFWIENKKWIVAVFFILMLMAFLEFAGSVYDLIILPPSLKLNSEPMLNSFENTIQKIEKDKSPNDSIFRVTHTFMNSRSGIFSLKMDFRFSENQDKNLSYVSAKFEGNKNISTFKSINFWYKSPSEVSFALNFDFIDNKGNNAHIISPIIFLKSDEWKEASIPLESYVKRNNQEKVADWETIKGYYLIIANQKSLRGTVYLDKIYFS